MSFAVTSSRPVTVPVGLFNWLPSLLFAAAIVFLPWEAIRGDEFADLRNYAARIYQLRDHGMDYFIWEDSFFGWLRFEYLWFRMLAAFADTQFEPVLFFKLVTAVSAVFTHRFLAAHIGAAWAFILLLNPITIDLLSSQIRSAFAFAVVLALIGSLAGSRVKPLRYALLVLPPFIHTGVLFMLGMYVLARISAWTRLLTPTMKSAGAFLLAIFVAWIVVRFAPDVASAAGDRRPLEGHIAKTPAYMAFWMIWGLALVYSADGQTTRHWIHSFALAICVLGPVVELMQLPGFRFVALSIPVIFATFPLLHRHIRTPMIALTAFQGLALIYYWVR